MKKMLMAVVLAVAMAVPTIGGTPKMFQPPISQFESIQLHEPFTLVYHADGPLVADGPSESTVTISASGGRLLYYVQSDNDPRMTVAIYDGHETYSIGEYGNARAAISSGFWFDQYSTMPLPAVGLPYLQIARYAFGLGKPPGPKFPMTLRLLVAKSRVKHEKMLRSALYAVGPMNYKVGSLHEDLETVPIQGFTDTNDGPVPTSAGYGNASVGWVKDATPKMLWLVVPQSDMSPLYLWVYQKHVLFEGFNVASEMRFTHFVGNGFDQRTDCILSLVSASETPLPDVDYSLEKYMRGYTQVDNLTSGTAVSFAYIPGHGTIQQQQERMELQQSAASNQTYSGLRGSRSVSGIALVLALVFGTATWLVYRRKYRKS